MLGAQNYGTYNYGLSWYLTFLPLSVLGIDWILSKEIGINPSSAPKLIAHTFILRTTVAFLLTLCTIFLAYRLETNPDLFLLLSIFSLALFFRSLALWFQSTFVAREEASRVLVLEAIFRLAEIFIGIMLLLQGFGLLAIAVNHAAIWALQGVFSYFMLRRAVGSFIRRPELSEIVRLLRLGLPFTVAALFGGWLLQGSLILYRHLEGTGNQLGHLALALQAFIILSMITGELGNAALPVLSRSINRGDGKSDLYIQEVLRLGWFLGGLLTIGAFSLGEPLITWVLGAGYSPVVKLLPWSLLIVTFYFWMSALQGMVGVHGHFGRVIFGNALGAFVFTASFFLLVPKFGEIGALVALGGGLFTVAFSHILVLGRHHALAWGQHFLRPALAAAAGFGSCWWLLSLGNIPALFGGVVGLAGTALLFGAVRLNELRRAFSAVRSLSLD